MGYVGQPRSRPRPGSGEFRAGLSVRQDVIQDVVNPDDPADVALKKELGDFFNYLDRDLSTMLPYTGRNRYERRASGFKIQDEDCAVTLAERGAAGRAADRANMRLWQPKDVGRVRGTLANRLMVLRRELELPEGVLPMVMNSVARVGDKSGRGQGRGIALLPATNDPADEYLRWAAAETEDILRKEIPGFTSEMPYLPHLTVVRFGTDVPPAVIGGYAEKLKDHVFNKPVQVHLGAVMVQGYDDYTAVIGVPRD